MTDHGADVDDEDEYDEYDGADGDCGACAGLEELMVQAAISGTGPFDSMGYVFGYSDQCELCHRGVDIQPALDAHERSLAERANDDA